MTGTREDRPAADGERCHEPSAQLAPGRIQHLAPPPEIAPDQRVRGRGLIVSHPVARGAEWACAAGYAKYVPKMITGSCAAVVPWPGPAESERDGGRRWTGGIHRLARHSSRQVGRRTAQAGSSPGPRMIGKLSPAVG